MTMNVGYEIMRNIKYRDAQLKNQNIFLMILQQIIYHL